jgi:hypothetical protein
MRRIIVLILVVLTACRDLPIRSLPTAAVTGYATPRTPAESASPTVSATLTPQPTSTFTPVSAPFTLTPIPLPLSTDIYTVQFHPEEGLFVGDQVSMEVISPPGANLKGKSLQVQVGGTQGKKFGPVSFEPFGLGNRSQATLLWVWDTHDLVPGNYDLTFNISPGGPIWTETVTLQPASAVPPPEPQAHWISTQSKCCLFYYITGTAAERDIQQIMNIADVQAADASHRMGVAITEPLTVTLLPRVLGNGGFTAQDISVSFLDRNYAGNDFAIVLHHEMIHALDARLGGDLRPAMLEEGLAVYMSGGHFRRQPILADAAALLQIHLPLPEQAEALQATPVPSITPTPSPGIASNETSGSGWLLPLRLLADNFYASQHEIGYLESAALVYYMIERWGWGGFNMFYRDIHNQSSRSQTDAINAALMAHFGISLDQLQTDFLARLRQEPVTQANLSDVQETIDYFDAMQLYQELLDPSAYFQSAWLLNNKEMRNRGIVADYLRHPSQPENLALETMLIAANQDWLALNYPDENQMLAAVNAVLSGVEDRSSDPFNVSPIGLNYLSIVQALLQAGYQPQRISLDGNTAQAWVTARGLLLSEISLRLTPAGWIVQ